MAQGVRTASLLVAVVVAAAGRAPAAPYTFEKLAETGPQFTGFLSDRIGLNDAGQVAFQGRTDAGSAVYRGSPGGAATFIGVGSVGGINDAGSVSLVAAPDGVRGIYVGTGGPLAKVVDNSGDIDTFLPSPSVNDRGDVAFRGFTRDNWDYLYVGRAGEGIVRRVDPGPGVMLSDGSSLPQINNAGAVAFRAEFTRLSGRYGFSAFVSDADGTITEVLAANTAIPGHSFGVPSLNEAGSVAAWEQRLEGFATVKRIVTARPGGEVEVIVGYEAGFREMQDPWLNDAGEIVFYGLPPATAPPSAVFPGIFTGPDPTADEVISVQDSLFGSRVVDLWRWPVINNAGQVAFGYRLADSRVGIALASPVPEPTAFLTALGAASLLLPRRPRSRRRIGPGQ